jgi:NADPH-dependent 2,4-dienoyl-CoA reductase/sulfur reductase-like enzyme
VQCALNARSGREWFYNDMRRDGAGRPVVVVGGGPSGCEAARVLAERGFAVTLFEKNTKLGGQLNMADKPPYKEKIDWLIGWFERQLDKLGVDVRLGTAADIDAIRAINPIAIYVGTGSEPIVPRAIPGTDKAHVYTTADILTGKVKLTGKNVAVIGSGMTGLETSELIATQGNRVSIIEMAPSIGPDASLQNRVDVTRRLDKFDVTYLPAHKLMEIRDDSVLLRRADDGTDVDLPADSVVLSLGVRAPQDTLNALTDEFGDKVVAIGDTSKVGRIANAVHTAFRATYRLQ